MSARAEPFVIEWDWFGVVQVRTVFLPVDRFVLSEVPLPFKTMIFGGEHDQYLERYETLEEAQLGHIRACDMVKNRAGIGNEKVKP